jgi:hypothetical protein
MSNGEQVWKVVIILALAAYYHFQWSKREWFKAEIDRNDEFDAPSDRQLKWDLRHMREDIYMIAITLNFVAFLGIAYTAWHW